MTKAWGAPGRWALDSEEPKIDIVDAREPNPSSALEAEAFPSLGEAVSKPNSKKKKQQQTFSLGEFNSGLYAGPGSRSSSRGGSSTSEMKGLTPDELLMLPSGPRERADDEDPRAGGLGGGFRDYGTRGGGGRDRDRDGGERGSGGRDFGRGFDRDRERAVDEPSRADETDDWGATKKFVPSGDDRQRRGGWTSAAGGGGISRADEVEKWGFNKESQQQQPPPPRYEKSRTGGFSYSDSRADDVDHWATSKKTFTSAPPAPSSDRQRRNGSGFEFFRREDAPPPSYDSDRWTRRGPVTSESTVAGPPASSERPRINLQPRSLPLNLPSGEDSSKDANNKGETEIPVETAATVVKPRPKVSPFGEAKPRDITLPLEGKVEKDMNWNSWRKGKADTDSKPPPPTGRSGTEVIPKEVGAALGELSVSDDTASSQGENGGADIQDRFTGKVGEVAEMKKTPERRSYKDVGGGNAWGKPNVIVDREREGNRW